MLFALGHIHEITRSDDIDHTITFFSRTIYETLARFHRDMERMS